MALPKSLSDREYNKFQEVSGLPAVRVTTDASGSSSSSSSTALEVTNISPANTWGVSSLLVSETNGTDGTYSYYIDMDTFRKNGTQVTIDGGSGTVTLKVYGTVTNDGTAPSSCTYQDISNDTFGSASWTADAMLIDNEEKLACYKYVKFEIVASTGGANDGDWKLENKKLY